MATDYPIEITTPEGEVRFAGLANFPDPDNQPASQSGPLVVPESGTTALVKDTPDGDTLFAFDADTHTFEFNDSIHTTGEVAGDGGATFAQTVDAGGLGGTIPYVTVQAAAPTTYQTPIVVDTTAVTGATYAWDGSAYQKIADLLT